MRNRSNLCKKMDFEKFDDRTQGRDMSGKSNNQFSQEISFWEKQVIFPKCCSRVEHNRLTKRTVNFPKNSPLEADWQFGLELVQIYTTL